MHTRAYTYKHKNNQETRTAVQYTCMYRFGYRIHANNSSRKIIHSFASLQTKTKKSRLPTNPESLSHVLNRCRSNPTMLLSLSIAPPPSTQRNSKTNR